MDIVYLLRDGRNEELRYSLRSLTNLPHDNVWAVGGGPDWLSPAVHRLRLPQVGGKWLNSARNLRAAVEDSNISDDFVLFNDDFFVTEPIVAVPALNRGPLKTVLAWYETTHPGSRYTAGMRNTYDWLRTLGIDNPLSFELHTPLKVNRHLAATVYEQIDLALASGELQRPIHWRTVYGNLTNAGGAPTRDVKVYGHLDGLPLGPFASTTDRVFRHGITGRRIRALFPAPSEYELR